MALPPRLFRRNFRALPALGLVLLAAVAVFPAAAQAPAGPPGWQYERTAATRKTRAHLNASLASTNSLQFEGTDTGSTYGRLVFDESGANGLVAYVVLERGRIVCREYNDCRVPVQFNDADATDFQGAEPADRSPNSLYLLPAARLLEGAKKSQVLRVSLFIHGQGRRTLEFRTARPLEWPTARR